MDIILLDKYTFASINKDIIIQIQALQADTGVLKGKVEKSKQALIKLLDK
jgi:hypothetical protein